MNEQELQQAFIQFLAQKTGAKSQQELEAIIQQMGEEGLKQAYAEFMQTMQQQQVRAAKFGAKLNYIKQLRGQCPDEYEAKYFKEGGLMTKKCVACQKGQEIPEPSNAIEAFKCGRKTTKKENGGSVEIDKCGGKTKKKACGGSMNKKVDKHLLGGKQRRPFTGFEGLSYHQEDPYIPSSGAQSRAERPLVEEIRNQKGLVMGRETWSDPQETGYYNANSGAELEWEPNETQVRAFNSLKRHALMNQSFNRPKFGQGGLVEEKKKANPKE